LAELVAVALRDALPLPATALVVLGDPDVLATLLPKVDGATRDGVAAAQDTKNGDNRRTRVTGILKECIIEMRS